MIRSEASYGATKPLIGEEDPTPKQQHSRKLGRTFIITALLLLIGGAIAYFAINPTQSSAVGVNRQYAVEEFPETDDASSANVKSHARGGGGKKGGKGGGKNPKPTKGPKPSKSPRTKKPKPTKPTKATTPAPVVQSTVLPFTCTSRFGNTASTMYSKSTSSCVAGETLVSCGIDGWQSVGGVYGVDGETCIGLNHGLGVSIRAVANCCTFPLASNAEAHTVGSGESSLRESATCPSATALTGCDVYYDNGEKNKLIGSYAGPEVQPGKPPQTAQWIGTENRCNAGSRPGGEIVATAHCIEFDAGYELECKTKAQLTTKDGYAGCEAGFNLMSCNTWAQISSGSLDDYHINNDGKCYVQQDGWQTMYANGICCQLTGPAKTTTPTAPPAKESGLSCYTVEGTAADAPEGFSRKDAKCSAGIRTGCSALYTGANDAYKGNWGVTASFDRWTPDADQGCAAGYYGEDKHDDFIVQARCCEDDAGILGVAIKKGQTKAEVEIKYDDGSMCIGTLNEDLEKQSKMYLGCLVSADIEMAQDGGTWSGSLDPGFGGVRRRPDGTCKGQTFSDAATDTCTGKDVNAGVDCMDPPKAIVYLDDEDVLYMDSIKNDEMETKAYKDTLIESAGFDLQTDVQFKIAADATADWLKADCGRGYWAPWRETDGWELQTISVPREVNGKTFACEIVDAAWSTYNKAFGVYESVVGCAKHGGGFDYDHGALVDCSGYLDDQIDECEETKSKKKNYGSYYDGELCKAQSSSQEIRAQAVCCTYT